MPTEMLLYTEMIFLLHQLKLISFDTYLDVNSFISAREAAEMME